MARLPPEPPTDPDTSFADAPPGRRSSPEWRRELLVRSGPAAGLRFALHEGVVTIGRSSQSDCPLHDEAVSRRHFELVVAGDGARLRDLGSGNGTRVNGRRVDEAELRHGDRVVIGNTTLEFLETPAEQEAALAPLACGGKLGRRPWLGASVSLTGLTVAVLISMGAQHRRHGQQRIAQQAFIRGLEELAGDPPDPDLALADFSAAQRDLPDQRALQDALAEARDMAGSIQRLAGARELSAQGNFADARRQLQGLPAGPYFERMARSISNEIDQTEAARPVAPKSPVPVIRPLGRPPGGSLAASGSPPKAKPAHDAPAARADDDRAEQLCDDADALLGPNPEAARRKYREALRVAQPGGAAARRAQGGLEN